MAGYTRQSTYQDGDYIEADDSNNEFDQLLAAFHRNTGHSHDGTTAEGPVIGLIGDAGITVPLNKVLIDTANNNIGFWVDVSSSSVEQLVIEDGAIYPVTDNDVDLGKAALEFKDGYFDGTVYLDALDFGGVSITAVLDEDDMSSDSATGLATQQSIKAYVDTQLATQDALSEVLSTGNSTGGTDLVVTAGDVITTDTINETTATAGVTIDSVLLKDNTVTATTFIGALTGNASTATTVTTNANLTGHVTSVGNAAVLGSFTKAQLDTAISDGTVAYAGGAFHDGFSDFVANEHIDWTSASSALVTTADITGQTLNATGDTSAGDAAAMGYTATEGLVLTGQGSTNDVTLKNDADATVMSVPTGTTGVTFAGAGDFSAAGIYLGGTAAANLLDDYEEGTWTPVMKDTTTGGSTIGQTLNSATYTKIGRLVYVNAYISRNDAGSYTGNLFMTGLPFTVNASTTPFGGGAWFDNTTTDEKALLYAASTYIQFLDTGINNGQVTSDSWQNGRPFYASFTYEV